MTRTTSPLAALLAIGLAGWLASCGDDATVVCTPGTTRLCSGVGRCEGAQACLADGSGYAECDCTGAPREGEPGDKVEGPSSIVARPCTTDAQCGPGLTCITTGSNGFFGGGVSGGYCSAACENDADCTSVDPRTQCVGSPTGDGGLCIRTCLSKDPQSFDENKCLGRRDLACHSLAELEVEEFSSFARQDGWCFPQCGSDEDCAGRRCDLGSGLCVDNPTPGSPIGGACTGDADCAGNICVRVGEEDFFCSAPCVFGQPVGCGYGLNAVSREATCFVPRVRGALAAEGQGDVGLCVELCDVDADCEQALGNGWVCSISEGSLEAVGRGICNVPPTDTGAGDAGDAGDAPDGGAADAATTNDASAAADGG